MGGGRRSQQGSLPFAVELVKGSGREGKGDAYEEGGEGIEEHEHDDRNLQGARPRVYQGREGGRGGRELLALTAVAIQARGASMRPTPYDRGWSMTERNAAKKVTAMSVKRYLRQAVMRAGSCGRHGWATGAIGGGAVWL